MQSSLKHLNALDRTRTPAGAVSFHYHINIQLARAVAPPQATSYTSVSSYTRALSVLFLLRLLPLCASLFLLCFLLLLGRLLLSDLVRLVVQAQPVARDLEYVVLEQKRAWARMSVPIRQTRIPAAAAF